MSFTIRRVSSEPKKSAFRSWLKVLIPLLPTVLQFFKHFAHAKEEKEEKKREKTLKRMVTILLAVLLVLVLLIGTLQVLLRIKSLAFGVVGVLGAELPVDENGSTTILLLGTGDKDHSGVDLTDTIMVASIDATRTKSVVLLSIPRDTYFLKTEKMGAGRVNSLYREYKNFLIRGQTEKGEASKLALQELQSEISRMLGIPLHGVIKMNFSGFEEAIDLMGGIDILVPEKIVDTQYPGPNYSYQTFSINEGLKHLDGATALKYARSRHTTSDFSRSARQQQIIAAAGKKLKEEGVLKNAGKITEMLGIISRNIESTLSTRELLGLAQLGRAVDSSRIVSVQLNDQNGLFSGGVEAAGFLYAPPREEFEGASVLLPVSVPPFPVTWKMVQTFSTLLFGKREAFLRPVRIAVVNAGAKEGSARKLGSELLRYGFDVVHMRNLPKTSPKAPTSVIAVNPLLLRGRDQTINSLKRSQWNQALLIELLKMKASETVDAEAFSKEAPDLVILLGEDYSYLPLQDLL